MTVAKPGYFLENSLRDYEDAIGNHPYVDSCNGSIVEHVLTLHAARPLRILDLGAGTGRVTRLFAGVTGCVVEALDHDSQVCAYFRKHPELKDTPCHLSDFVEDNLPAACDVLVARGVYHHIPASLRVDCITKLVRQAKYVVVADEFLAEYDDEQSRRARCLQWYTHIIDAARTQGLTKLAELESGFLRHELTHEGDHDFDHKESCSVFRRRIADAGASAIRTTVIGKPEVNGGCFMTVTIRGS